MVKTQLSALFVPATQKIDKADVSFLPRIHPTLRLVRRGASAVSAKYLTQSGVGRDAINRVSTGVVSKNKRSARYFRTQVFALEAQRVVGKISLILNFELLTLVYPRNARN